MKIENHQKLHRRADAFLDLVKTARSRKKNAEDRLKIYFDCIEKRDFYAPIVLFNNHERLQEDIIRWIRVESRCLTFYADCVQRIMISVFNKPLLDELIEIYD